MRCIPLKGPVPDDPGDPKPRLDYENLGSFREPTPREHWIAAGLFVGFGIFFILLFFVLFGWWPRWVILGLGVYSCLHGIRHARDARRWIKRP